MLQLGLRLLVRKQASQRQPGTEAALIMKRMKSPKTQSAERKKSPTSRRQLLVPQLQCDRIAARNALPWAPKAPYESASMDDNWFPGANRRPQSARPSGHVAAMSSETRKGNSPEYMVRPGTAKGRLEQRQSPHTVTATRTQYSNCTSGRPRMTQSAGASCGRVPHAPSPPPKLIRSRPSTARPSNERCLADLLSVQKSSSGPRNLTGMELTRDAHVREL